MPNGGEVSSESNEQDWPEELDALTAAPRNHLLLFENDAVRVLDTRIVPGATVPLHTHRWPSALYVISWSDFVRRDGAGTVLVDSRGGSRIADGRALWSGPLPPHTLENVGIQELHIISIEVKSAEAAEPS
jgi:hypothetical protein